jgi:AcrR family transcriptional regulator
MPSDRSPPDAAPPAAPPAPQPDRARYHHGDLRAALLAAGEVVLAETGVPGFSLRAVAKRVGVSHSAPAHHFGDAEGLLAALATEGFRRFLAAMQARQAAAGEDPLERLIGSGLGYLDFARAAPALFRLMFASDRIRGPSPELAAAARAAYGHLVADIARLRGVSPHADAAAMQDVTAVWSMVHGFAELLVSDRLGAICHALPAAQEAQLAALLRRAAG